MKNEYIRSAAALTLMMLLSPVPLEAGEPLNMRAILFNNNARIIQDPVLPICIDGLSPAAGHPWYESRIFAPPGPPPDLTPKIEVSSSIAPSDVLRIPGRVIPSPFDLATFRFKPRDDGGFVYTSRWPQVFTPRDDRNTVVLALVNRAKSLLFNTNFDLQYSLDQEVVAASSGIQTATISLTPRVDNQTFIVRVRTEATQDADPQLVVGSAMPPPSSETPTSVIWNVVNPARGETLTFTVQAQVSNFAFPTSVRHVPGLLITASPPSTVIGTATGRAVNFPEEFLPRGVRAVKYSLSREADWNFEHADRTLVDIRELTELVP